MVVVIFAKFEQAGGIVALFELVEALRVEDHQIGKGRIAGPVEESRDNAEEAACIVLVVVGGSVVAFDLEPAMQRVSLRA